MKLSIGLAATLVAGMATVSRAQQAETAPRADVAADGGEAAPKLILETAGFTTAITSLDFSADGRLLVASGADKAVRIWDLTTGALRTTLRGQDGSSGMGTPQALEFSPDGRALVVGVTNLGPTGAIRIYDNADFGRIAQVLPGHALGGVEDLAFSADGKTLASAGRDGKILLWDWPARRLLRQIECRLPLVYLGFPLALPLVLTIDGAGTHGIAIRSGKDMTKLPPQELQRFLLELGDPTALQAFATRLLPTINALGNAKDPFEGKQVKMRLYLDTGHAITAGLGKKQGRDKYYVALYTVTPQGLQTRIYEDHSYIPTAMAISPDRAVVASGDFLGEIHVWDARTGRVRLRLTGAGQSVYRVGFDETGQKLAFGTRPHEGARWRFNDYADPDRTFDLEKRRIVDHIPDSPRSEVTQLGDRTVTVTNEGANRTIVYTRSGGLVRKYPPNSIPTCLTILRSDRSGVADPVVFGLIDGTLAFADARTVMTRRSFLGHQGGVMSLSESSDGRFLASSSTDRTIRLWSLEGFTDQGDLDIDLANDGTVRVVVPGGPAEQAGIRTGDRFLAIDGIDWVAAADMKIKGQWKFRAGQRVTMDMARAGRPYRVTVPLAAGSDQAEPLLSLFVTADNEWVAWTPQGYYDASLGGDRLIGWHVNQGLEKAAKFYVAQQFRKQFYRPDIIDHLLKTGDMEKAVSLANAELPHGNDAGGKAGLDLRRPEDLKRVEPPHVRILAPAEGSRSASGVVTVRARVESQNGLPIREVTILINGRPSPVKGLARVPGEEDARETTIEREIELQPGLNRISLVASNAASASQPVTVSVTRVGASPAAPTKPKLYLLAIGISEYAQADLNLRFPHLDAEAFAAAWKRQEGPVFEKVESRVLTNKQATSRAILAGMDWLVKNATSKDVAVLFLSAHGFRDERQNYYLATHDIDPESLRSTAVRWNEVKGLIQDVPGKFILFVDTCHSGGITGAKSVGVTDPLRELVSEDTGAIVFSSSLAREVSLEDPKWGHGAFTRALLDTMEGPAEADYNHDGYLSLSELNNSLAERVKGLTKGRQHTATEWPPTITDFNFFRFNPGAPG